MSKKQAKRSGSGLSEAAQTWYHQGLHAFKRGTYEPAIASWQKVLGDKSYTPNAALEAALAEANFRAGQRLLWENPDAALTHLISAATLQKQDALYAYHVGLAYQRQKQFAEAIQWLETALSHDPKFGRAAYILAIALTYSGKDPAKYAAWNLLTPAQQAHITHAADQDVLSSAFHLLEKDQWEQAAPHLAQAVQETPGMPAAARGVAFYYQGVSKQRQKDSEGAVADWRKASELGLDTPSLQQNLSVSYLPSVERAIAADNWDTALAEVERALKTIPENKRLRDLYGYIKLQQGYKSAMQGRWQDALQSWQAISGLSGPNARNLAINLAIAFEKLEHFEQAADAWRDFVKRRARTQDSENWLSSEQVSRLWARISSLYQKAGKPDEAVTTLQTAIKYQEDDADMRVRLAHAYAEAERFEAAHNEVGRALKLAPEHIGALVLHAELSEFSPLRADWQRHIDDEPGITEWKAVLVAKDEAYNSVAREHLTDLYHKQISRAEYFGMEAKVTETFKEAVTILADDPVFRAEFIEMLLLDHEDVDEATKQIAQLDLTNEEALVIVAAAWIAAESPTEAAALIQKADALKSLTSHFFTELGGVMLEIEKDDEAARYFDEALLRAASDPEQRIQIRLEMADHYLEAKNEAKGLSLIDQVLKEQRGFAPALMLRGLYYAGKQDTKAALKDLTDAEKWARNNNEPELVEAIRQMKMMLSSPFGSMFGGMFGGDNPFGAGPSGGNPFGGNPFAGGPFFGNLNDMDFDDEGDVDADDSPPFPMLLPRRGKSKPKKNTK